MCMNIRTFSQDKAFLKRDNTKVFNLAFPQPIFNYRQETKQHTQSENLFISVLNCSFVIFKKVTLLNEQYK